MIWETRLSGSLHEIRHIPGRAKNAWCPRQLFEQWGYPSLNPVACSHIDADNTPVSTRQTPKQSLPANIAEKEGINHTTQKWTNLGKWTSNYLVVASFLLSWTWEAAKHTNHVSSYLCSNGIQQTIDAYVPSDDGSRSYRTWRTYFVWRVIRDKVHTVWMPSPAEFWLWKEVGLHEFHSTFVDASK